MFDTNSYDSRPNGPVTPSGVPESRVLRKVVGTTIMALALGLTVYHGTQTAVPSILGCAEIVSLNIIGAMSFRVAWWTVLFAVVLSVFEVILVVALIWLAVVGIL